MNINNVRLEAVAVSAKQYPSGGLPEIVLLGRSNVGKSSLINAVFNRKNLARTSGTPGKTATINFYNVDDKVRIVDLPGYGYASRGGSGKWAEMIEDYICKGKYIYRFIQLIDIRHLPMENDKIMFNWIQSRNLPQTIVFTKADKISKTAALINIEKALEELVGDAVPGVPTVATANNQTYNSFFSFSTITKQGVEEFLELIKRAVK